VGAEQLVHHVPWSVKRLKYSPSAVVLLAGSKKKYENIAHHNIHFGKDWKGVFDDLIEKKQFMQDPSLLVTNSTQSDPGLAPKGKEIYYVLFPTPNTDSNIDWKVETPRYRDEMVKVLEERGYTDFGANIEVEHLTGPLEWEQQGMKSGAPFASAHTFLQTGPFRPGNMWGENVVFAGSGTIAQSIYNLNYIKS